MKKLAVLNWSGHGNFGDDLFIDAYRELFSGWDIRVFSDSPKSVCPLIDFKEVNKCDLFALGGGELINRDRLFIPSEWARKIEVPKIILGCGVNAKKFSQLKINVLHELYNFEFIGLRDYYSIALLNEDHQLRKRVGLFYDLLFSMNTSSIEAKAPDERVAVIIPTDRTSNKSDRGIMQYGVADKSLKWLKQHTCCFDRLVFLAFGKEDNDDYATCLKLSKAISKPSVIISDCGKNKDLMLKVIANATSVYAYRLHGLILAKIFNKPCGFFPYHWKLNRVQDTILGCTPELIKNWQRQSLSTVLCDLGLN